MSSYRCPLCGANHKDAAERCRLCGQSLAPGAVDTAPRAVAKPVRAKRGIKGVVLIGLGLVFALLAGGLAFGLLRADRQVKMATDLVTGTADGWSTQAENEGQFQVDLPGTRTRSAATFAGTDDGNITAWQSSVGDDTEVLAGWGTVTPPLTDGKVSNPLAIQYLKETVIPRWAVAQGIEEKTGEFQEGTIGGLPAVMVETVQPQLKVKGKEAFAHVAVVLRGTRLYVLQVLTIYKDTPQLNRMANTFVPTAA
jgi:hypothetical protein